jgi:hypothetical protein
MRTAAIRTTARNARCSVVTSSAPPGPVGDHTPLDEMGDSGPPAEQRARRPFSAPAPAKPVARTPNMSVRSDRLEGETATPVVDTRRPPMQRPRRLSWRRAGSRNRRQRAAELRRQACERLGQCRRSTDHHERHPRRRRVPARAIGLAQSPARAITLHSSLELSTHGEPRARRLTGLTPQHDEGWPFDPSASLKQRLELGAGGQPLASGKATL